MLKRLASSALLALALSVAPAMAAPADDGLRGVLNDEAPAVTNTGPVEASEMRAPIRTEEQSNSGFFRVILLCVAGMAALVCAFFLSVRLVNRHGRAHLERAAMKRRLAL